MPNATPHPQPPNKMQLQPFARWHPIRGIWETSQPDLFARLAPYSVIWPTSGWMHNGSAYQRPLSALLTNASESSYLPAAKTLFRTPLASDSSRGGETPEQVRVRRGTIALSHQIIDLALNGPPSSNKRIAESENLWLLIEDIFNAGDTTQVPSPDGNTSVDAPPPRQHS